MPDGARLSNTRISKPDNVRVATQADERALGALLLNDLRADNDMGLPVAEVRVWRNVISACRGMRGIAGVIDGPDGIVASVGIFAVQGAWYSSAWFLSQTWLFVKPGHRARGYARDLFAFAEWHRADISARLGVEIGLETSVLSGKRLGAKARLWRRFARPVGHYFWSGPVQGWEEPDGR